MIRVDDKRIIGRKGGGKGGGGGKARPAQEAPNTLRSKTVARICDLICEGEIVGLADGAKSVFLDDTPVQNPDGSYNFEGFSFQFYTGTGNQNYMPGFSEVEAEFNVSTEVKYGKPITRNLVNSTTDAVRVKVRLGSLYKQNMENGDINGTEVSIAFERSDNGGPWQRVITDTISGKTMSAYERAYRIPLPKNGHPWSIRMVRLSADPDTSATQNATHWASYTTIVEAKLMYPDSAYAGVTVDSELFGSNVPGRSYEVKGRIIRVPTNYDPESRKYSGLWDGTFKWAYSNNPAWCYFDLLTHPRFGLGREIGENQIDKWGLYSIGQYCDELVPDGRGGEEPRFTFNGGLHTREDAVKMIATFAGAFRGMVYFAGDTVYINQDRPSGYKRLLAPANVIDGNFVYEGSSIKARHSVALVSWLDPQEGYKPAVHVVEDPDSIAEFGWRPTDEVAFGCTSQGQADRWGRMILYAEKNSTETVSFSTGLDCADIMPGDVVAIADPSYAGLRAGGRLAEVSHMDAVLDAEYPFAPNEQYQLAIIHADNTLEEIPIENPATSAKHIRFARALQNLPVVGSMYIVVATNLEPRLFRIMGVEEGDGFTLNFVGLLYDPNKYESVEHDVVLPPRPTTVLPTGPLQVPYDLNVREYLYMVSMLTPRSAATFSYRCEDPRVISYEVQVHYPNEPTWTGNVVVAGLSVDIDDTEQGHYKFRVRSMDALGRYSAWAYLEVDMLGMYAPPSDVTGFLSHIIGDTMQLVWDPVPDLDLKYYEIRYSSYTDSTVTWENVQPLIEVPAGTTTAIVPTRKGTYLIKAVDVVGVESVHATILINDIGKEIFEMNVIATFPQDPDWLGRKDHVTVVDMNGPKLILEIDPETGCYYPEGYYYFNPEEFDLGGLYISYIETWLKAGGFSTNTDFFNPADFFDVSDFFDHIDWGWRATIEMQITEDMPGLFADWYDWADFYDMPDFYVELTKWSEWIPVYAEDVRARAYRFRIKLESFQCDVTPAIEKAGATVDMPDRLASHNDKLIPADPAGTWVDFVPPFMATPTIVITVQDGQEGDSYKVHDKDRFGYKITIFDVDGNVVSRPIDGIYKGYGAQIDYIMP